MAQNAAAIDETTKEESSSTTTEEYSGYSKDVYDDDQYREGEATDNGKTVISSTNENDLGPEPEKPHQTDLEDNGMQASVIATKGTAEEPEEIVIAFRGSESPKTKEGRKDWGQDAGMRDDDAYKAEEAQFLDAKAYIDELIANGTITIEDIQSGRVTFTGHSLGGALASYCAVVYGGQAEAFNAPSCYNWFNEEEKEKLEEGDYQVTNNVREGDVVKDLPYFEQRVGNQKEVRSKRGSGKGIVDSHDLKGYMYDKAGEPIPEITKSQRKTAGKIALEEGFLGSEKTLLDSLPALRNMKKTNDVLITKMQEAYQIALGTAMSISKLSFTEVEQIAFSEGLDVEHNIKTGAVEDTTTFIDKKIKNIKEIAEKIETAYNNLVNEDSKNAKNFNGRNNRSGTHYGDTKFKDR